MNLLAHAYLSFNRPELLVGNMISDYVKGKRKFDYSTSIQQGIALHRAIDTFTDEHPATKEAKAYLRPTAGAYSGAFVDVAYDHFLAADESEFTEETLKEFSSHTYNTLEKYQDVFPLPFRQMFPYMKSQDWLYNYRNLAGAEKSFGGLVRRAKYINDSGPTFKLFVENYSSLQKCYNDFFPLVKQFAHRFVDTLELP